MNSRKDESTSLPSNSTSKCSAQLRATRSIPIRLLLLAGVLNLTVPLQAGKAGPPVAPASLSAVAVSSSQVGLTWLDKSSNETGYIIQRAMLSGGPWSQIATTAKNATAYTNSGLSAVSTYFYRVCAYNSRGSSAYAGPVSATTPQIISCTYTLSPTTASVAAAGGSGSLTVSATAGCSWAPSSDATTWLTCTPASGSGSGSVSWSATPNSSTSSRSGTLTIGGQSFTVTQSGAACTYSISSTTASATSSGG